MLPKTAGCKHLDQQLWHFTLNNGKDLAKRDSLQGHRSLQPNCENERNIAKIEFALSMSDLNNNIKCQNKCDDVENDKEQRQCRLKIHAV